MVKILITTTLSNDLYEYKDNKIEILFENYHIRVNEFCYDRRIIKKFEAGLIEDVSS